MRLPFLALVLLISVRAAGAASAILYATDASTNGVDGFCIRGDGSLAPTPATHVDTLGDLPRRLVIGPNRVLYVCDHDRVEAFSIGARGRLSRVGSTDPRTNPNMNPLDVAVSADGTMLYVPLNGQDVIGAYRLDATGAPEKTFSTCVKGTPGQQVQRLIVVAPYLYAVSYSLTGRISVFPVNPDGTLSNPPDLCKSGNSHTTSPTTCPVSDRRRLDRPRGAALIGNQFYVASILKHRLFVFPLTNGLFDPPIVHKTGEVTDMAAVCADDDTHTVETEARRRRYDWEKPTSKTNDYQPYQEMIVANGAETCRSGGCTPGSQTVAYGAQFPNGRIDAFQLTADGNLPRRITQSTKQDLRGTPVGLLVRDSVLYVADGENDRVQAFLLDRKGMPATTPFSDTNVQKGTFPNALASIELSDDCE